MYQHALLCLSLSKLHRVCKILSRAIALQFVTVSLILPSCMVTYLGQAAYMLRHPDDFSNPYFNSLPEWAFWPVLVIATLASIVSAQSLISGKLSMWKPKILYLTQATADFWGARRPLLPAVWRMMKCWKDYRDCACSIAAKINAPLIQSLIPPLYYPGARV